MAELTFKTEEERVQALNNVPEVDDAPPNTDLEEYRLKIDQDITDIQQAKIVGDEDPNNPPADPPADPPAAGHQDPPATPPAANIAADLELERKRNETLLLDRDKREETFNNRLQEFEAKIKKFEEGNNSPSTPKSPADTPNNQEITAIQSEIDKLEVQMNDPDVEVFDEDYIKIMKKKSDLDSKLNRLLIKSQSDQMTVHKKELDDLKRAQTLKTEKKEKDDARDKVEARLDKWRDSHDELKGKSYREMDDMYTKFAKEVGAIWYGKAFAEVEPEEAELAVDQYLKGTPALVTAMSNRGVQEPEDLRKFILLSEINATKMGYKMNKSSGKWEPATDDDGVPINFPNFDAAYDYIKGSNKGKDLLDAQNSAAKNVLNAVSQRANPVELNDDHKGAPPDEMTKEQAHNVLNTFDEEQVEIKRRKNDADPMVVEYNKALVTLGYSPLAGD